MIKTYSDLSNLKTFLERFNYLKLEGQVGFNDPEVNRWLHQIFYHTKEWKETRTKIVMRDNGFDLGAPDRPILGRILIHHIEPITKQDILDRSAKLFDPENLISTSHVTHNAIHYSDENLLSKDFVERTPGDTKLW